MGVQRGHIGGFVGMLPAGEAPAHAPLVEAVCSLGMGFGCCSIEPVPRQYQQDSLGVGVFVDLKIQWD